MTKRPIRLLALLAAMGMVMASCATVRTGIDQTACVFNEKTGELVKGPITSGKEINLSKDEVLVTVPRSIRFWNQSTGGGRDVAAASYSEGPDAEGRQTRVESEIKFMIHPANACEFYVTNLARYDGGVGGDLLQFEVEGNASTGWMRVLGRNVDTSMADSYDTVLRDHDGLLAALDLPSNASPDGSLPEGETAAPTLDKLLESPSSGLGQLIVDSIEDKFGGKYICGTTTDITDPNDCDPVTVEISSISLAPSYSDVVNGWRATQVRIETNILNATNAEIEAEAFDLEEAQIKAANEREARLDALAEERRLAELNTNEETNNLEVQRQADEDLAVCDSMARVVGAPISAADCIQLLIVQSNQVPEVDVVR